jgi:hypothetical protein
MCTGPRSGEEADVDIGVPTSAKVPCLGDRRAAPALARRQAPAPIDGPTTVCSPRFMDAPAAGWAPPPSGGAQRQLHPRAILTSASCLSVSARQKLSYVPSPAPEGDCGRLDSRCQPVSRSQRSPGQGCSQIPHPGTLLRNTSHHGCTRYVAGAETDGLAPKCRRPSPTHKGRSGILPRPTRPQSRTQPERPPS